VHALAFTITRRLYSAVRWKPRRQFFVQGDRSNYSREMYLATDKTQNDSLLSTSAVLGSLYIRGLIVLLRGSWLLKSSFLPRGTENGQLLQYGHAYQLSVRAKVKTMDAREHTAEQCENGNAIISKRSYNETEH
jgi:hypothetical protein